MNFIYIREDSSTYHDCLFGLYSAVIIIISPPLPLFLFNYTYICISKSSHYCTRGGSVPLVSLPDTLYAENIKSTNHMTPAPQWLSCCVYIGAIFMHGARQILLLYDKSTEPFTSGPLFQRTFFMRIGVASFFMQANSYRKTAPGQQTNILRTPNHYLKKR